MKYFTHAVPIKKLTIPNIPVILALLLMIPSLLVAQSSNTKSEQQFIATKKDLQAAVNAHNKQKIVKAKYGMKDFMDHDNNEMKKWAYYYMAYADYRLFILFPEIPKKQKAQYLNEAITSLKKAETMDDSFADGQALLGSVYGMKMGVGGSGQVYGPKSDAAMRRALKNGPDNPRVHMLHGIGLLYSPPQYGGGAQRAIEQFEKSAQLFVTSTSDHKLMPGWGHAEVYAWLGQAYGKNGQLKKAQEAYDKALNIDPNYGWVKYTLLPALKKKMN